MAETTDRSQSAPVDAGLPTQAGDAYQPYRPLSLLALGGFGLAALSAVVVCLGGWIAVRFHFPKTFLGAVVAGPVVAALVCLLIGVHQPLKVLRAVGLTLAGVLTFLGLGGLLTYSNSDPWLLPPWVLVLPAAGLLLAWLGRNQILRSEDTLSGLPLCNWGMGVVAVFTLIYVTYYAATVMAVRYQSTAFVDQWLDRVKKGDIDRAFLMTLPPDQRPAENAELRMNLETYWNQPGPSNAGPFTEFGGRDFVRLLQAGADDAKVLPMGLLGWKYEAGEFQMHYGYRVDSALCSFPLEVIVTGREDRNTGVKGRQWYVDMRQSGRSQSAPLVFTPAGQVLGEQAGSAREFVDAWFARWYRDDDDAYLWTLPADVRAEVQRRRPVLGAALSGTAGWAEPGRPSFYQGGLIEADAKTFYAGKENRAAVPAALRRSFRPGEAKPDKAMLSQTGSFPLIQSSAAGKRVAFDGKFLFGPEQKEIRDVEVDAQVVLECDAASLELKRPQWQVKQVNLIRAHAVQAPGEPGGPGGPGLQKVPPPPPQ